MDRRTIQSDTDAGDSRRRVLGNSARQMTGRRQPPAHIRRRQDYCGTDDRLAIPARQSASDFLTGL